MRVNGQQVADAKVRVSEGAQLDVLVPAPVEAEPAGEAIPLHVIFEDDDLIVVDKPAGLVVHPGAGHDTGTLVNALIYHCGTSLSGIGGVLRPGIVHRLDRDTSGLMVVAKSDRAHSGLAEQFAAHGADGRMQRRYRALVWGQPDHPAGTVDARLARSKTNRLKIAVVRGEEGRHAVTHYRVSEVYAAGEAGMVSELEVELETGRTHQIRVHMASIRHPVLCDPLYATGFLSRAAKVPTSVRQAMQGLDRQALHAEVLGFKHPVTGEPMLFESALPSDIANLRQALSEQQS